MTTFLERAEGARSLVLEDRVLPYVIRRGRAPARRGSRVAVRHAEAASTPERYQAYVQRSRGIRIAKPSCVWFQNAWQSDRPPLCHVASGKPVVVQDTGPSSFFANG